VKLIFNAAVLMVEVAVAVALFSTVTGAGEVRDPLTWVAAILAAVAIDVLGGVLISVAIRLHQGRFEAEHAGSNVESIRLCEYGVAHRDVKGTGSSAAADNEQPGLSVCFQIPGGIWRQVDFFECEMNIRCQKISAVGQSR
jgi:hypothetical protein